MITVQYEARRNGDHHFWVGRHGPYSIRIDANRPGVYRWMITCDARSLASGVAADRDQAANDAPPPLMNCQASCSSHWTWGTLGAQSDGAHGSTADSPGQ
jgi:hypothetical protein